jgi:indolepyruvate ferredoxin oxidoreductase alpha subunit
MAERSFAKEVGALRLGAGQVFEGEAILAVTKALLQSGVGYVGGYQGAPVSHLMDVLADASEILGELGVTFESSASEATAAAMLATSINYPIRGAVTWKSTVGTNVASDALSNLASAGVTGGALIVLGEDYGEGASIMQERTHAFAMKSQMWLLDPRPDLPTIVRMVEQGFELSEASHTPVMLMMRIRACHMHGRFVARDNRRPPFTAQDALANPQRTYDRIILPPSTYAQEQQKVNERWPAAVEFIRSQGLNEVFAAAETPGVGIIVQGGLFNTLVRALERLGLADVFGESKIPIYVLNVTYPLVPDEVRQFAAGKRAVLIVEEGQPEFLEQAIGSMLAASGSQTRVIGKGPLPVAGEYTGAVVLQGLERFLGEHASHLLAAAREPAKPVAEARPGNARPAGDAPEPRAGVARLVTEVPLRPASALAANVPARPSGLCTGCPERPLFATMKLLERELGPIHVSADIGCHSFSTLPPFDLGASIMGYGLGPAGASALSSVKQRRPISLMGDGGFWHNGLTSGIGNAVFNKHDGLTIIVDNGYSAATGGQYIPSSQGTSPTRKTRNPIEAAVRGVGVEWVRRVHTYDMKETHDALKEAMTTQTRGPKVVIAEGECQLNRQRRVAPQLRKLEKDGGRVVRQKFGVDEEVCTGDHSCIRLSGCPSLTIKPSSDPLRTDPVAHIDNSCVGCGVCGEVAHAAILCPSFYRADVISNPTRWERWRHRLRARVIRWLAGRPVEDRSTEAITGAAA